MPGSNDMSCAQRPSKRQLQIFGKALNKQVKTCFFYIHPLSQAVFCFSPSSTGLAGFTVARTPINPRHILNTLHSGSSYFCCCCCGHQNKATGNRTITVSYCCKRRTRSTKTINFQIILKRNSIILKAKEKLRLLSYHTNINSVRC